MVLGRCLEALRRNQAGRLPAKVIPVRDHVITSLFREVLTGNGNLVLSVHVTRDAADVDAARHALRFGALAAEIQMAPAPPPEQPAAAMRQR